MTRTRGFEVFDTAVGPCAILWGVGGILGLHLPQGSAEAMRSRLRRSLPEAVEGAATPALQSAIARIVALLDGGDDDLADLALDMSAVPAFPRRVYELARRIRPGRTRTYGELAAELGEPGAARAVGRALGSNPFAIIVPCHRVLAAGGRPGGFSAPGGIDTKRRLLEIERARIGDQPSLFEPR